MSGTGGVADGADVSDGGVGGRCGEVVVTLTVEEFRRRMRQRARWSAVLGMLLGAAGAVLLVPGQTRFLVTALSAAAGAALGYLLARGLSRG
ncbi:hypothetical protein [Micromonospora sp. NPDC049891]|uniref:hypothetical protein n=1 Tax=Micromonospora sp. NPDC049891 TaxID=3155655 RepID=UPI0033D0B238